MVRRQAGAAAGRDAVGEMPRRAVGRRREHFGPEIETAERGREMELRRRQQLDAIGGIVRRSDFVEMVEIDLVVAQVEFSIVARLPFELERAIEVARPDIE